VTDLFMGAMYGLLVMAVIVAGWCLCWAFSEVIRETLRPVRPFFQGARRRLVDVLWIRREEGAVWPRGYGLVSKYYTPDGIARGTIVPFNLLVGWSLYAYWKTRFGWAPPPSWADNRAAFRAGQDVAFQKGYDAGYELGANGG